MWRTQTGGDISIAKIVELLNTNSPDNLEIRQTEAAGTEGTEEPLRSNCLGSTVIHLKTMTLKQEMEPKVKKKKGKKAKGKTGREKIRKAESSRGSIVF